MDLEEFNHRAVKVIQSVKEKSWLIKQASVSMKNGVRLHKNHQVAVYNFIAKKGAEVQDAEVLAFAKARATKGDCNAR